MTVRPVDAYGDMMPVVSSSQMLSDAEAVGQIVEQRLKFYYGEWWEDETLGIRIPDFLINTAKGGDLSMLIKYICSYVVNTAEVTGVKLLNKIFNYRQLYLELEISTTGGSTIVEVDLNGLL